MRLIKFKQLAELCTFYKRYDENDNVINGCVIPVIHKCKKKNCPVWAELRKTKNQAIIDQNDGS